MKYLLIVFDGMADEPMPELDGKTPLQVARKPFMDSIAERGRVGSVKTTPVGMEPGSDVTNMGILGYDPAKYYRGRGPIEAASLGIPVEERDVVLRTNLVSTDGTTMLDSSAGHVSTEEARELMAIIDEKLSTRAMKFYPGVSYRHIMVWHDGSMDVHFTPPYKIQDKPFAGYLPQGDGESIMKQMIFDSLELLDNHPINRRRRDEGKLPANMIWFWAQGMKPALPDFFRTRGLRGSVVAAVDLIRGLGTLAGLKIVDVPGATGYTDTNYLGKGQYALSTLREHDFTWVHVEAADEAAHEGNLEAKIEAIENMDKLVLGTILNGFAGTGEDFKILLLPDHPTPTAMRSHTSSPVPFILYSSRSEGKNTLPYDERSIEETKLRVEEGYRLIDMLFED